MGLKLRSGLALTALFGLIYALVFVIGIWNQWSLWLMVGLTAGIVFFQYLISPYIIQWIYKIEWIPFDQYKQRYPHLADTVKRAVELRGIKTPRVGIIRDGNPNAFTFGHTKNNARIVITTGILDYLDRDEQQAVMAHELGHVVHNDFILMTIVFAIPLILLTIARWAYYASIFSGARRSSREGGAYFRLVLIAVAVLSYVAYYIGYLISLFISRIREYYADEHSADLLGDPNALSTGLVKIAYGLVREGSVKDQQKSKVRALRGLGIFDPSKAQGLAAISTTTFRSKEKYSKEAIDAAAAWDLFNPWAKYYQLYSTHPLPAKRILRLNEQCEEKGIRPEIDFSQSRRIKEEQAGKTMLDQFLLDLTIKMLPAFIFMVLIGFSIAWLFSIVGLLSGLGFLSNFLLSIDLVDLLLIWAIGFYIIGFGFIIRTQFMYKSGYEPMKIRKLVSQVKASPIRAIPAYVEGVIVGRGVPGYYFSEDLYLDDGTGIMYIDYQFGIRLVDFFFSLKGARKLVGEKVRIRGWYRRGPSPYLQVDRIETTYGKTYKNYRKHLTYFWAIICFIIGLVLFYFFFQISPLSFFGLF
ncbi:MAG: zinc metalloprotease HtpX [Promethearchaeia archaeon]